MRQRKITENAILSATLLALVAGFTFSTARSQRPTGPLPDQLQKTVDTKQITIKQALDALNVGTSDGVVPEMKFYALAPKIYMLVEILRQVNIRRARM